MLTEIEDALTFELGMAEQSEVGWEEQFVKDAAAAIAKRLSEEAEADLATAQAQVAEMAEALELAGNAITYAEQHDLGAVVETIKQTLSAAPKVACTLEGRWIPEPSLRGRIDLILLPSIKYGDGKLGIALARPLPDEGKQVKVFIVLDKQGEGE